MGVPAMLISTEAFVDTCRDMAKIGGLPEMRWALCPHPLGSLDEVGLMERAESAAEQFAAIITGR